MHWVPQRRAFEFLSAIATSLCLSACGGGGGGSASSGSGSQHVNHAPVAANDVTRVDGAALASINVLSNDNDPDGDALTVTIATPASVGTVTVNSDKTVRLASLPSDFKGVTTFSYTITDPSGASASANAAIFVGTDPFRVVFAGDSPTDGTRQLYLTNFAAAPVVLGTATQGSLRLEGFAASADGSAVVFRRADPASASSSELDVIKTGTPTQQTRVALPAGMVPVPDASGRDQFVVSDDGKWIAVVAGSGGSDALYLVSVASPATVTMVSPSSAVHAGQPRFVQGSAALYFLATSNAGNTARILYTVAPSSPGAIAQVSAPVAAGSDDLEAYSVAPDQSRIALLANRNGSDGIFYVDPAHLQTEIMISHPLALGEILVGSTVGLTTEQGGSALVDKVAYTSQSVLTGVSVFVADVSATPAPHQVAGQGSRVIGFRPDDAALLYSRSAAVYESLLNNTTDTFVGPGSAGWYDSTGNIVVVKQFLPSGKSVLAATTRGAFGTTQQLGIPVLAADYFSISGIGHGVAILGEGPASGTPLADATLSLVNALAPDKLVNLASFVSPIALTSESALVVD